MYRSTQARYADKEQPSPSIEPLTSIAKLDDFKCLRQQRATITKSVLVQTLPSEYIENQKAVDESLLGSLDGDVKGYLGSRFSLKSADRPHLMKF